MCLVDGGCVYTSGWWVDGLAGGWSCVYSGGAGSGRVDCVCVLSGWMVWRAFSVGGEWVRAAFLCSVSGGFY